MEKNRLMIVLVSFLLLATALTGAVIQVQAEDTEYDLEWTVEIEEYRDLEEIEVTVNVSGFDGNEELYLEAWVQEDSLDRGETPDYEIETGGVSVDEDGWANETFTISRDFEEGEIYNLGIEIGDADGEIDYYTMDFQFGSTVLPPVTDGLSTIWGYIKTYWYYVIIILASLIVIGDAITREKGWIQR